MCTIRYLCFAALHYGLLCAQDLAFITNAHKALEAEVQSLDVSWHYRAEKLPIYAEYVEACLCEGEHETRYKRPAGPVDHNLRSRFGEGRYRIDRTTEFEGEESISVFYNGNTCALKNHSAPPYVFLSDDSPSVGSPDIFSLIHKVPLDALDIAFADEAYYTCLSISKLIESGSVSSLESVDEYLKLKFDYPVIDEPNRSVRVKGTLTLSKSMGLLPISIETETEAAGVMTGHKMIASYSDYNKNPGGRPFPHKIVITVQIDVDRYFSEKCRKKLPSEVQGKVIPVIQHVFTIKQFQTGVKHDLEIFELDVEPGTEVNDSISNSRYIVGPNLEKLIKSKK